MLFDTAADGGVRMSAEWISHARLKEALLNEQGFASKQLHAQLYRGLFRDIDFREDEYRRLADD
jgi:hypothetical protein